MSLDFKSAPLGVFVLRVSLGAMYLAHSIVLKLMTFGLAGTAGYFAKIGLPEWLAYLTFGAEAIGGAMLVLGVYTRVVAIALLLPLLGSIIWVHGANGWMFAGEGGGWEYPAFLIAASVTLALLGDGALAIRKPARA